MSYLPSMFHDVTSIIGVISPVVGIISGAIGVFGKIREYLKHKMHKDLGKMWKNVIPISFIVVVLSIVVFVGDYIYINNFKHITPCCTPIATSTFTSPPTNFTKSIPSLVQHNFQNVDTASNTIKFAGDVSSGNLIIVAITQFEGTLLSVTDNNENNYVAVALTQPANPPNDYVELYYAKDVRGGLTKVTVTFSSSGDSNDGSNVGIYEYSGLSAAAPLEEGLFQEGFGNTLNRVPLVTTEDNEVCFAVGIDSGLDNSNDPNINKPPSPGIGYKLEDQQDNSVSNERFYTEDATEIKAGSPGCQPNFSIAYNSNWAIIGAAFKP